jgi:hypothetical protein
VFYVLLVLLPCTVSEGARVYGEELLSGGCNSTPRTTPQESIAAVEELGGEDYLRRILARRLP